MKLLKTSLSALLLGLLSIGFTANALAQDAGAQERKAIQTYNDALAAMEGSNYQEAINLYKQAITEAQKVDRKDIIERSKKKLPQVHLQVALSNYKQFQKDRSLETLETTIENFRTTKEVATEYGDNSTAQKANGIITKLMYQKSVVQYQQNKPKEALTTLNAVIERNPNYATAYYQKGIVMKNMDSKNLEAAVDMFKKAIEVGKQNNQSQIANQAQSALHEELVYRGSQAVQNKEVDRGLELLKRALEWDSTTAAVHFRLAQAYNKKQQWQQAVEHAQQSLEYETGGKTDRAKIYYELGLAYKGTGDKEQACSAMKNAAFGSFKNTAEHQMEYELECESATN
ncbi:MAG: tetratricopeptide repeat protein [Fodinibius sp.]|nr:tetratricopeptide repeat protein [Fodinibius sp.]